MSVWKRFAHGKVIPEVDVEAERLRDPISATLLTAAIAFRLGNLDIAKATILKVPFPILREKMRARYAAVVTGIRAVLRADGESYSTRETVPPRQIESNRRERELAMAIRRFPYPPSWFHRLKAHARQPRSLSSNPSLISNHVESQPPHSPPKLRNPVANLPGRIFMGMNETIKNVVKKWFAKSDGRYSPPSSPAAISSSNPAIAIKFQQPSTPEQNTTSLSHNSKTTYSNPSTLDNKPPRILPVEWSSPHNRSMVDVAHKLIEPLTKELPYVYNKLCTLLGIQILKLIGRSPKKVAGGTGAVILGPSTYSVPPMSVSVGKPSLIKKVPTNTDFKTWTNRPLKISDEILEDNILSNAYDNFDYYKKQWGSAINRPPYDDVTAQWFASVAKKNKARLTKLPTTTLTTKTPTISKAVVTYSPPTSVNTNTSTMSKAVTTIIPKLLILNMEYSPMRDFCLLDRLLGPKFLSSNTTGPIVTIEVAKFTLGLYPEKLYLFGPSKIQRSGGWELVPKYYIKDNLELTTKNYIKIANATLQVLELQQKRIKSAHKPFEVLAPDGSHYGVYDIINDTMKFDGHKDIKFSTMGITQILTTISVALGIGCLKNHKLPEKE